MTIEEANKAVVYRFIEEVINQNKVELIDELFAPERREQVKKFLCSGDDPFPDGHEEIKDMVAEGNTVMVRWNFRGTHKGTYLDIPATGKSIEMIGFAVYYLAHGQITDDLMLMSNYGVLKQLGATIIPPYIGVGGLEG